MVVVNNQEYLCAEEQRLKEDRERKRYWKKWGPYTAERQWATGMLLDLLASSPVLIHEQFVRTIRMSLMSITQTVMLTIHEATMVMLGVVSYTSAH